MVDRSWRGAGVPGLDIMIVRILICVASSILLLARCGESGEKAAGVVEAASKRASDFARDIARLTPEKAKEEAQELANEVLSMLRSIDDPAAAEKVIHSLQPVLDTLGQLGERIGKKLDLAAVQKTVEDLATELEDDPRFAPALQTLRDKVHELSQQAAEVTFPASAPGGPERR